MKAIHQTEYGSADVLQFGDVPQPAPGDNDVLIRVHAAGLHAGDWHVMTGRPYMLRAIGFGVRAPKVKVRGIDVAGVVVSVGRNVSSLREGDEVFGTCDGAFAEYACAPEQNLAKKPPNLTLQEAATLPTSAFAALQALRDFGKLRSGQSVLIIGASGGVGAYAVQIAKAMGAAVTGVCSTAKVDWVRSLGADHVIDYTRDDFVNGGRQYDLIIENGGHRPLTELRQLIRPGGIGVLVGGEGGDPVLGTTGKWLRAMMTSTFTPEKIRPLATKPNHKDLLFIKELAESGRLQTHLDRAFPLERTADAFRHMKTGRGSGKIVIQVS